MGIRQIGECMLRCLGVEHGEDPIANVILLSRSSLVDIGIALAKTVPADGQGPAG